MTGQQLKNSILQMAVQGKLVPQDPNDEPASVLLERIRKEKEQLIKDGKIKKEKNPSIIFRGADNLPYEKVGKNEPMCIADEVPFDIPESWEWVRISGVFSVINGDRGKNYPAKSTLSNTGIPFISAVNLDGKTVIEDDNLLCLSDEQFNKLGSGKLEKDDVVVCIRGSLGKHGRYPFEKGAIASSLVILRPHLNIPLLSDFIMMYLDSPLFFSEIKRYNNGTAQPNLAAKSLEMFFLPLPPLPEQKRIVEKLNEVSSLTDNYAEAYVRVAELNQKFPELLKKSILQEAVQGKLVSQDPNDEPASVLLERIRAEKQALIKAGKIKKGKHESVIFRRDNSHYEKRGSEEVCIDDEIPFEIPDTWEWCRIGSLLQVNPRNNLSDDTDAGFVPMVLIKDGFNNEHSFEERKWGKIKSGFTHFANNDVIVAKITPCFQNRKSAVIANLPNGIGAGTTELHVLRDVTSQLCMQYILLLFKTNEFIKNGVKNFSGTAGQQRIGKDFISNYLIPLPPVKEQERIVNSVLKVFSRVNSLAD